MPLHSVITDAQIGQPSFTFVSTNEFFQQMETDIEEGFLNPNEFAEKELTVTYLHQCGHTFKPNGIFDNEYELVEADTQAGVVSTTPVFICQTRKFTIEPEEGDSIIIRGKKWKVQRPEPDGTGITVLPLHHYR